MLSSSLWKCIYLTLSATKALGVRRGLFQSVVLSPACRGSAIDVTSAFLHHSLCPTPTH